MLVGVELMPIADRREKRYLLLDTFYNVTVACIETLNPPILPFTVAGAGLGWARWIGRLRCTLNQKSFLFSLPT